MPFSPYTTSMSTEPVISAAAAGIPTVEINPTDTDLSEVVSTRLQTGAVEALTKIWSHFQADHG